MGLVACPRHGVVDVAADAPCPSCGVAAYDLGNREARDVVRRGRDFALAGRTRAAGVAAFFAAAIPVGVMGGLFGASFAINFFGIKIDLVALLAGGVAAAFAARPLALKMEKDPRLQRLDEELARNKV